MQMGENVRSYSPTSRVSRLCLRKMRFSERAHSMFSFSTVICVSLEFGMASKKSRRVRTSNAMSPKCIKRYREGLTELGSLRFSSGRHERPRKHNDLSQAVRIPVYLFSTHHASVQIAAGALVISKQLPKVDQRSLLVSQVLFPLRHRALSLCARFQYATVQQLSLLRVRLLRGLCLLQHICYRLCRHSCKCKVKAGRTRLQCPELSRCSFS